MKKNLNLNPNLSLRALKNRALRAAARSAADKAVGSLKEATKSAAGVPSKVKPKLSQFERDIRNICQALRANADEGTTVVAEKMPEGTSGRWMVSTYITEELSRQKNEEAAYRQSLRCGADRAVLGKPVKARPIVKYVFYPHAVYSDRLGSVAIYGANASSRKFIIDRMGCFLGHKVARTSLEMGLRLFVDVKFAI